MLHAELGHGNRDLAALGVCRQSEDALKRGFYRGIVWNLYSHFYSRQASQQTLHNPYAGEAGRSIGGNAILNHFPKITFFVEARKCDIIHDPNVSKYIQDN